MYGRGDCAAAFFFAVSCFPFVVFVPLLYIMVCCNPAGGVCSCFLLASSGLRAFALYYGVLRYVRLRVKNGRNNLAFRPKNITFAPLFKREQ